MKKTFRSLVAVVLLLCTIFTISSCSLFSRPPRDLEKAADNLEDEDYYVRYYDDEDDIYIPGVVEYLSASDEDGENYLTVLVFKTSKAASLYKQSVKMSLDHEMEEIKNKIEEYKHEIKMLEYTLKKFDDDLDSDEIDEIEEEIDYYEDRIKEYEKELKELKKETVIGKSGKTIWFGTKDALKDSKG